MPIAMVRAAHSFRAASDTPRATPCRGANAHNLLLSDNRQSRRAVAPLSGRDALACILDGRVIALRLGSDADTGVDRALHLGPEEDVREGPRRRAGRVEALAELSRQVER